MAVHAREDTHIDVSYLVAPSFSRKIQNRYLAELEDLSSNSSEQILASNHCLTCSLWTNFP